MAPLAPIAIAATAAAAVVSAAGSAQAAAAAKATGEANKLGYERAAKVVEQQKEIVDASAANELFKFNRAFKINQANSTAAYLKSGVTLEGTPEDVLANNAYLASYERKILDYNTAVQKKKLDDDDADDSDGTDDFVFQPGVGFIPRRRFLRRVQTLKEGDLPTARKGGLMGQ